MIETIVFLVNVIVTVSLIIAILYLCPIEKE
jgi:hypothetical protein